MANGSLATGVRAPVAEPHPGLAPASLSRGFVFAGLALTVVGGSALGAANLALAHAALGPVPLSHVQAHGHAQTFGFIVLFICGFGYFLLPRMVGLPLPYPRLARVSFPLLAGGAALHFLGQPIAEWWPGRLLLGLSGPALLSGALCFSANALRVTWGYETPFRFERFIQLGSLCLVAGAALDATLAILTVLTPEWEGLYPGVGAQPLWHLMVYGLGVCFALGISTRTLPAFLGGDPVRPLPARLSFYALAAGVPAQALALYLAGQGGPAALWLDVTARATVGAGLLLGAAAFRWRRRPTVLLAGRDRVFLLTAAAAYLCLALAGAARIATALAEALGAEVSNLVLDAERHLVTVGFLVTLIVAMGSKMVPMLARAPLRLPRLRALAAALLVTAVAARSAEALAAFGYPDALRLSAWSGIVAWTGLLCFAASAALTLRAATRS